MPVAPPRVEIVANPGLKNEIQALIDEVDNKGLMNTWRAIEKILSSNGLVSSLQILPDKVGVHPSVRGVPTDTATRWVCLGSVRCPQAIELSFRSLFAETQNARSHSV